MKICKYYCQCCRPCPDQFVDCARYLAAGEVGIENVPDDVTTIAYWRIEELIRIFNNKSE